MNKSKLGQRLLIYGAIVLIYALVFKDVTVYGDVVNLELLSQRQNLVIVGALMVLVGTILRARATPDDKAKVPDEKPSTALPLPEPEPEVIPKPKASLEDRLQGISIESLNEWRPRFRFRVAFAVICSVIFMNASSFSWPFFVVALSVFLALSMRKLQPNTAVSKTCFWAVVLTLPFNIFHLMVVISHDIGVEFAMINFAVTAILIGCYIKYRRS